MTTHETITVENPFKDSRTAFEQAIKEGRLTENPTDKNYAGKYMYMGWGLTGKDCFKNINTRQYDV